jgi:UDPglucose 6-dehydrogenase
VEVVANPHFLREGAAIIDFFHGDRIVIGTSDPKTATIMEGVYQPLQIPIFKTDIRSAEMIKFASNAFLATKKSFMDEMSRICENVGANIEEVAYGIGHHKKFGNEGSYSPMDTKTLAQLSNLLNEPLPLLETVIQVNNR